MTNTTHINGYSSMTENVDQLLTITRQPAGLYKGMAAAQAAIEE